MPREIHGDLPRMGRVLTQDRMDVVSHVPEPQRVIELAERVRVRAGLRMRR